MNLIYQAGALPDDLPENGCVVRRAVMPDGTRYWHLWFYVRRETDGELEMFVVPVNPRGPYVENGPGGKTWGLSDEGGQRWQVSPSINLEALDPNDKSIWHQTPTLVGVPDAEPWTRGDPA